MDPPLFHLASSGHASLLTLRISRSTGHDDFAALPTVGGTSEQSPPAWAPYVCSGAHERRACSQNVAIETAPWDRRKSVPAFIAGLWIEDCDKKRHPDNLLFDKSVASCEFLKERETQIDFLSSGFPRLGGGTIATDNSC
jgi:hypothetical protein